MDIEGLRKFLIDSNRAGYAGGEEKKWIKEPDGSTRIPFEKGEWRSDDHFYGGEPYVGMMIVSYESRAVWSMIYYGWVVEGVEAEAVYGILRGALMQMPEEYPYRGPQEYKRGDFVYRNKWDGELDRFSGEETIEQRGKLIYKADYRGGEVDKRRGV
ncbi:hypothetical protein A2634_03145 [Candidatus Amesbacteria bacterium RIFCSPHIGHO2_01_FULL_48_32]|uniref:DUF5680 domain-containing protein n=1 Tax=Candidatus Amesbacteria bacterium RIFCSPLOWO2_01_FULL_48_25 TaxID=1797259 RepID=A0A1F4ZBN0_9BACT|nr:MAG: hypothetical protein A2634_03145 [Candidatus Amesbacteria bacterium RIFCSPHIGHO2_01_FULL_48_32]OGD03595.1 MAG: hypothetical protein A2989_02845 [Candidatus Amesbacteria bacterium RIFCSPLOWO2_01_FULL_48_25]HJZ04425.1 DUF5680 domain-containing protein [Patescibacteria group bacterium]